MKKIAIITLILFLLNACGQNTEKKPNQSADQTSTKEDTNKPLQTADYSSLFTNYKCDMTPAEIAKIFNIPESYVSSSEYKSPGRCVFLIQGFGKNGLGKDTAIQWKLEKVGKQQVNKEIKNYLNDQANNESVLGMGIELSETGDTYITKMPFHGRLAIMNSNYDSWMFMDYAPQGIYKGRTKELHDELGEKMILLANYLLKKHKK